MTSVAQVGSLSGLIAASLLLTVSGIAHLRDSKRLLSSLLTHRILSYRVARIAASSSAVGQLTIVLAIVIALATRDDNLTRLMSLVVTALFGLMTLYLVVAIVRSPSATCNCFGRDAPLTWVSAARSAILCGCSGTCWAVSPLSNVDTAGLTGSIAVGSALAGFLMFAPGLWGRDVVLAAHSHLTVPASAKRT